MSPVSPLCPETAPETSRKQAQWCSTGHFSQEPKLNAEYDHSVTSGTASACEGSPVSPVNSPVSGEKPEKIPKKPEKLPKKNRGMFSPPLKKYFEASKKIFQALFVNPITKWTQPHRLESSLVLHRWAFFKLESVSKLGRSEFSSA